MRLRFILLGISFAVILGVTIHHEAAAACRWEWDCSRGYPCQQVQVCDDALDLPTIRPPQMSPIPPPSIRPIPRPTIPPLGNTNCWQDYLCDSLGNCRWETVCQ